jgi:hypothetical protein
VDTPGDFPAIWLDEEAIIEMWKAADVLNSGVPGQSQLNFYALKINYL